MMSFSRKTTGLLVVLASGVGSLSVHQSAEAQPQPTTVILRVDGDAGGLPPPVGDADGSAWGSLAFRFLQDAISVAEANAGENTTVQIWVAATDTANPYRPDQNEQIGGTGYEDATFSLSNFVELYGGFQGTESLLSQRDPETNTTVLNGVLGFEFTPPCGDPKAGDCGVPHENPGCDDPACCQAVCGVMPSCCTVEWTQECVDLANAGVVCEHCGDPGAADCFGLPTGTPGCSSASCCAIVCSDPAYEYCCTTEWDVSCLLRAASECLAQAHHVVTATGVDGSARLDGFTVTGGYADAGGDHGNDGAGALVFDASPVIARCMFRDNDAPNGGGAGIEVTGDSALIVINCSFTRNSAVEGQGMRLYDSQGGAAVPVELVNCAFFVHGISLDSGSAISANGPDLEITNCTFFFNDTIGSPDAGGQIKISNGSYVTMLNSIVWGMTHGPHVVVHPGGFLYGRYDNVQSGLSENGIRDLTGVSVDWREEGEDENTDTHIGENWETDDPRFVSGESGDLRFSHLCSRCIDRGKAVFTPEDSLDVDNDGDVVELTPDRFLMNRLRDGLQQGNPPEVDMGAHEFVPPVCPWDCQASPDGAVGIGDLLDVLAQWDQLCTPCDLGLGAPRVGVEELLKLLGLWGFVCPGSSAPSPPSLEDELTDACLTMADWDQHVDTMTDPGSTQEEQDNSDCWMRHHIDDCDACSCDPPASCPGADPFN